MLHALQCLYISVPEDVAKDVNTKVMNYVKQLEERCEGFATNLYRVRKERNGLRKALKEAIRLSEDLYVYQRYASNPEGRIEELKQIGEHLYKHTERPEKWLEDKAYNDFVEGMRPMTADEAESIDEFFWNEMKENKIDTSS